MEMDKLRLIRDFCNCWYTCDGCPPFRIGEMCRFEYVIANNMLPLVFDCIRKSKTIQQKLKCLGYTEEELGLGCIME